MEPINLPFTARNIRDITLEDLFWLNLIGEKCFFTNSISLIMQWEITFVKHDRLLLPTLKFVLILLDTIVNFVI